MCKLEFSHGSCYHVHWTITERCPDMLDLGELGRYCGKNPLQLDLVDKFQELKTENLPIPEDEEEAKKLPKCDICDELFSNTTTEDTERPVKLPNCGHIFGQKCIEEWMDHSETCPICRGEVAPANCFERVRELNLPKTWSQACFFCHGEDDAYYAENCYRGAMKITEAVRGQFRQLEQRLDRVGQRYWALHHSYHRPGNIAHQADIIFDEAQLPACVRTAAFTEQSEEWFADLEEPWCNADDAHEWLERALQTECETHEVLGVTTIRPKHPFDFGNALGVPIRSMTLLDLNCAIHGFITLRNKVAVVEEQVVRMEQQAKEDEANHRAPVWSDDDCDNRTLGEMGWAALVRVWGHHDDVGSPLGPSLFSLK